MSKKKTDNLRERIIEIARQQLLSEGYREVSLRKIAREVGVTPTSIYLHFDSRDHLIHTLMEHAIEQLNEILEQTASQPTGPVEKLEALAREYVEFAREHPREYQVIYLVSSDEMSRYPKEKFRRARRGYEIVSRVIEEGVAAGEMDEDNPRVAAYTLWAQLHGVMSVVLSRRLDTRIDQDEFIEQAIQHIIHGFRIRTALKMN